jgi:4-amino-4-deoxy-L-arabinose transferase-like glycosyltransferase
MLEASDATPLSPPMRPRARTVPDIVPMAIAAFAWLAFSIGARPLSLPDEGRYVGVAWEMLRSGNWIVPTEDGLPFFHKPPLFYWLTAGAMRVFGPSLWSARFAPLAGASLGAAALYLLTRRWIGERQARAVLVVLLLQPFFFGAAQFANLDMLVAGCISASIAAAAHAVLLMREQRNAQAAIVGAWLAAGLGVLAKGLIGVALPMLVVLAWLLANRQWRLMGRLGSPLGLAVFALVAAPWFLAMQARFPEFGHYFFVVQHLQRFAAGGFNNVEPWWYFVVAVPLVTLPWSAWLVRPRFGARAEEPEAATLLRRLMWTWLVVVAVFFSIPQSKPIGYIMPLLFPVAALAADAVANRLREGSPRATRVAMGSAALAALLCLAFVFGIAANYHHDDTSLARMLKDLRGADDPVVFVGEYFFDVPYYARLNRPVRVVGDWHDPAIVRHDSWRHELADAAAFAPTLAATLLVDADQGLAVRCGAPPLWVLAKEAAGRPIDALAEATRIATSNEVTLWRLGPRDCRARGGIALR